MNLFSRTSDLIKGLTIDRIKYTTNSAIFWNAVFFFVHIILLFTIDFDDSNISWSYSQICISSLFVEQVLLAMIVIGIEIDRDSNSAVNIIWINAIIPMAFMIVIGSAFFIIDILAMPASGVANTVRNFNSWLNKEGK